MTEHVLPYDHSTVPQEHYYDCGPASAQVVLSGRGIVASEQTLIGEIGTTESGTDYVGLITPVLNRYLNAGYVARYIGNDPATQSQKDLLWADIVASINAGFGVVANIDAPPSNYPRGVKGSANPAYGGGEVFHYISIMGYDDTERAVWVADSGFKPFGYWCSFDQMATLIPPKGYTAAPGNAPTTEAAVTIFGIDIANFQEGLNLGQVKAEGFEFVWAKVSEGDSFRDRTWPGFRDAARANGLLLAGYHYVRTGSADAQADLFVDHLGDKSIPAMLDFEDGSGDIGNYWAVKNAIEARGVRVALSYIPRWYWQQIGSPDISNVPGLIQSSYVSGGGFAKALYPGDTASNWAGFGGREVDVLQFTDKASVAGMSVDANAFRGSTDQLRALLGATQGGFLMALTDDQQQRVSDAADRILGVVLSREPLPKIDPSATPFGAAGVADANDVRALSDKLDAVLAILKGGK